MSASPHRHISGQFYHKPVNSLHATLPQQLYKLQHVTFSPIMGASSIFTCVFIHRNRMNRKKDNIMNIEGTYTFQASPEAVWRCLSDQQLLTRALPGIEGLERVSQAIYTVTLSINQTPLKGTYKERVTLSNYYAPYYCHIGIDGDNLNGDGIIQLRAHEHMTILNYKGSVRIGKLGALVPPALTRGITKLFLQQFFNEIAARLRDLNHMESLSDEEVLIETSSISRRNTTIPTVQVSPIAAQETLQNPPLLQKLVHLSGLGEGDPEQEVRWTTRIRRIGIASGLLFLVWIGTRLPRR